MLKKTSQIEVLNEKINNKAMEFLANEALSPNNKMKIMDISSFTSGNICDNVFSKNTQIYVNPTEALRISQYVKEGDKFATVLSSGDFTLDAVFAGARNILTFDISKFQYPMALLKTQAMKVLDFEDYYSFFSNIYSKGYLSPEIYNMIVSRSKNPLLFSFWDIFMQERKIEKKRLMNDQNYRFFSDAKDLLETGMLTDDVLEMIKSLTGSDGLESIEVFNDVYYNATMKKLNSSFRPLKTLSALCGEAGEKIPNSYIESSSSYEETRKKLGNANIKYIRTDVSKLKPNLERAGYLKSGFSGFNSIYLSNIPEFFNGQTFLHIVKNQLMPLLAEDGSIIYCIQGVDEDVLKGKGISSFEHEREDIVKTENISKIFNRVMEINDAESYDYLNSMYDVSLDTVDTFCKGNGNGKTDIYVKVMKK